MKKNPSPWLVLIILAMLFSSANRQHWTEINDEQKSYMKFSSKEETNSCCQGVCKMPSICEKYRDVRLQCATAGNFNNCVNVLMDKDGYWGCDIDGTYTAVPEKLMPNKLQCFALKYF